MNMFISGDANSRTGVEISEEIYIVIFTELLSVILHSGRPTDISVDKNSSFFHL